VTSDARAIAEFTVRRGDRDLHAYVRDSSGDRTVFWLHGTPNIGLPPEPLFATTDRLGLRWVGYDRPGYGGSSPHRGRRIGSAAADVAAVADAVGVDQFVIIGHSSGAAHALACAALLPTRVTAVVAVAGLAPADGDGLDWFEGMGPTGRATLQAALDGYAATQAYQASATATAEPDFTAADWAALAEEWGWFHRVVEPAMAGGPGGLIDDDLATAAPWGFDVAEIRPPVLLLHGGEDQVAPIGHAQWLSRRCPQSELWLRPADGHISVLRHAPEALDWLSARF